ncbi:hypothetical protein BJ165DRAFT_1512873 [Panaeolus papilionaceus]|nr:hypothetical protein BJ165DRAFT_1512873 [Panaeolus papilionaceus]
MCKIDIQDTNILVIMCWEGFRKGAKVFPSLQVLRIRPIPTGGSFDDVNFILLNVVVLEEICVSFDFLSWHLYQDLNLTPCFQNCRKTLREVNISAVFGPHVDFLRNGEGVVRLLCNALEFVRGQNVIEVINIKFEITDVRALLEGSPHGLDIEGWRRLDFLLMRGR